MPVARIYQPHVLQVDETLCLSNAAAHHVARVLRARVGDSLILFNGQGGEYEATIQHIDKKQVVVSITTFVDKQTKSPLNIHLAQGIARGEKMDLIVQKAVELGVHTIVPLLTERCNVKWEQGREEKRLQHWRAVAISACEQSGRNDLPTIAAPVPLSQWIAATKADLSLVLSPHVKEGLPTHSLPQQATIALLIGPEGGLTTAEVDTALQHSFLPWHLGPRILRTETAPLAAISVLQYCYGDFAVCPNARGILG